MAATLGRITTTLDMDVLATCDVVIEAVIEDLSLKRPLYAKVGPAPRERLAVSAILWSAVRVDKDRP